MLPRAIVVTDRPDISTFLHSALTSEDFGVTTVRNGADGIRRVYDILPDVIILEDRLSITASGDLCHQIRRLPYIPLILLGDGDDADGSCLMRGLQRGADFYMKRPVSIPELVARVKALLRRRQRPVLNGYPFLNVEEQCVVLIDRSVSLSPTEFRLLAFMLLNRGRVIPAEEFFAQVWAGQDVNGDSLRFYISRLRQKLNHSTPHNIYCHRGVGYRFGYAEEQEAIDDVDLSWVMPEGDSDLFDYFDYGYGDMSNSGFEKEER